MSAPTSRSRQQIYHQKISTHPPGKEKFDDYFKYNVNTRKKGNIVGVPGTQQTKEELVNSKKKARTELREIQQKLDKHRGKEIIERVEAYIEEGKLPQGKALEILIEQKKARR